MPAWLEALLVSPYAVTVSSGMLVGWALPQLAMGARRDAKRPPWPPTLLRIISMFCAFCGALLASGLVPGLDEMQAFKLSILTGLLCPLFWSAVVAYTKGKKGWMGKVHVYLKGDRRFHDIGTHLERRADGKSTEETFS